MARRLREDSGITPRYHLAAGGERGIRFMQALGIDIGGTGIKGAPVDLATGEMLADRKRLATPQPATPDAVTEVVREVAQSFGWTGAIGATFPGVVSNGTIRSAANV